MRSEAIGSVVDTEKLRLLISCYLFHLATFLIKTLIYDAFRHSQSREDLSLSLLSMYMEGRCCCHSHVQHLHKTCQHRSQVNYRDAALSCRL